MPAASWTDRTAPCVVFVFARKSRGEALQLPVLLPWLRATSPGGGQLVQGGLGPCGRGLLAVLTRTICHQGLAALQQWPGMTSRASVSGTPSLPSVLPFVGPQTHSPALGIPLGFSPHALSALQTFTRSTLLFQVQCAKNRKGAFLAETVDSSDIHCDIDRIGPSLEILCTHLIQTKINTFIVH